MHYYALFVMLNTMNYYKWFRTIINVFINTFFFGAVISTLYVFSSAFSGLLKITVMVVVIVSYLLAIFLGKKIIKETIEKILESFKIISLPKMILIISILMIFFRVVFSLFFNFDASSDGDVSIYCDIADALLTGQSTSHAISHLYGMAVHIATLKMLNIPLTIGTFIAIWAATIMNFYSFSTIVGKEKSFLVALVYIIMPSTTLYSMCPTHEVFVYLYLSLFLLGFNLLIKEERWFKVILLGALCILSTVLCTFVNPAGYMIIIIMGLSVVLSGLKNKKKIVITVLIILSLVGSNYVSSRIKANPYYTKMNTYTILIHGVNPDSLGEQVDGYPNHKMREYLIENNINMDPDGYLLAAKEVLFEHYINLLTNPVLLCRLVLHKFYILYSGVHYPINLANFYGAFPGVMYYVILSINTLIYLFMITVGVVYFKKKEDCMMADNYRLALLGNLGVTMLCIVVNKYSVYVTMFIFFISIYRSVLGESNDVYE